MLRKSRGPLAESTYGEHRATTGSTWPLCDTHGLHLDNFRSIWPTSYVIRASNQNKPFDQFRREQLPPHRSGRTLDTLMLGYARGITRRRRPLIEDCVSTTSAARRAYGAAFLGCRRCATYDHKFIPSREGFLPLDRFLQQLTESLRDDRNDWPPFLRLQTRNPRSRTRSPQTFRIERAD